MPRDELIRPGEVWLVGAGPGDPDLMTRKAEKLIAAADVVFHDALVGSEILELVHRGTRIVSVGKRSGRHSKDQKSINALLVEAALAGNRVVRLKGGDPSIFGRSGEELAYLAAHGISAHICPGVTAASAAAASARVSLTLRGLARRLEFVTAHARAGEELDLDWDKIADSGATLCVYMGKAAAAEVAGKLMKAGLSGATPVLAVENASLPNEHIFSTRLDLLALAAKTALDDGPAVLLIGEAVERRQCASGRDFLVSNQRRSPCTRDTEAEDEKGEEEYQDGGFPGSRATGRGSLFPEVRARAK